MAEPAHPDPLDEAEYGGIIGLGHIDALPADDDELDEEDAELEAVIERHRRAGGLELERGIGFTPFYWRR